VLLLLLPCCGHIMLQADILVSELLGSFGCVHYYILLALNIVCYLLLLLCCRPIMLQADILVSELLGSFGDNELSPE
jgi:hypothetical protein